MTMEDYHHQNLEKSANILQHLSESYIVALQVLTLFFSRQLNPQAEGRKAIYWWVHQILVRATLSFKFEPVPSSLVA